MKKKYTTIKIPKVLNDIVYELLEETGEPLFYFLGRAVEEFIDNKEKVEEKFLYRTYDEQYIKREKQFPLYLAEKISGRAEHYKKEIGTTKSNIVIQALENRCKRLRPGLEIEYFEH